jgi:hypothetical protein
MMSGTRYAAGPDDAIETNVEQFSNGFLPILDAVIVLFLYIAPLTSMQTA